MDLTFSLFALMILESNFVKSDFGIVEEFDEDWFDYEQDEESLVFCKT